MLGIPMPRIFRSFTVLPNLPERLKALQSLAYNLWWCWHPEAWELFRRIDADAFERLDHSPVRLLEWVSQDRIRELAADDGFLVHLDRVADQLQRYLGSKTW